MITALQGRPSPLRSWCIPLFSKKFLTLRNFFTILPFPKNFLIFIRRNSWWLFFSHRPQISNFPPIFHVSVHFPTCFTKIIIPPTFTNFPPVLKNFTCFLHTLCEFRFPLLWSWCIYASPNARTGRPWLCTTDYWW